MGGRLCPENVLKRAIFSLLGIPSREKGNKKRENI